MRCSRFVALDLLVPIAAWALLGCAPPPLVLPAAPTLNPDLVQRGAFVFADPRSSGDGTRACATCHPGGASNGASYRDGVEVPPGSPGARNVPSLRGAWQTAPYMWDGSVRDLRSAIERMLAIEMRGAELATHDLEALLAYVQAFEPFDRGRLEPDGTPIEPVTLAGRRGAAVFLRAACDECHPAPIYARPQRNDMGTGTEIDVPTLRGLSSTPPYGHDGRWDSIAEAVQAMLSAGEIALPAREREQLVEYLKLF